MLRLRDITVRGADPGQRGAGRLRDDDLVLRGVSLDVPAGTSLAVVGANGSGKSTLARVCAGLQAPDAGTVELAGAPVVAGAVGLVLQDPAAVLVGMGVADELALARAYARAPRVELITLVAGLAERLDLADLLGRAGDELSGGEAQRVAIGAMLATGAAALVLDEPTAHLDAERAADVVRLVRAVPASGVAVAWITQSLADAAWCDRVAVLRDGGLLAVGPTRQVLADEALLGAAGLELPAGARLAERLRARGVDVPLGAIAVDDVVDAVLVAAAGAVR